MGKDGFSRTAGHQPSFFRFQFSIEGGAGDVEPLRGRGVIHVFLLKNGQNDPLFNLLQCAGGVDAAGGFAGSVQRLQHGCHRLQGDIVVRCSADQLADDGFELVHIGTPMEILQGPQRLGGEADDLLPKLQVILVDESACRRRQVVRPAVKIVNVEISAHHVVA